MPRTCVVALFGVVSLLLAGCGGSAPAPSAYVAAGDAICTMQLAQLNKLPQPSTPAGAFSYLPHAVAIMQRERSRLAALQPPAPTRAQFAAGLESQGQLAAVLSRVLHQLETGVVEVGTFSRVEAETNTLRSDISAHLRRAGLARCAS